MTTITIELPDDLAANVAPLQEHLSTLLYEVFGSKSGERALASIGAGVSHQVYDEMLDFLVSGPTPEQLVAHKISEPMQNRLRELMDKNREGGLTEAENAELDVFESVEDLMGLLKAKAHCVSSN